MPNILNFIQTLKAKSKEVFHIHKYKVAKTSEQLKAWVRVMGYQDRRTVIAVREECDCGTFRCYLKESDGERHHADYDFVKEYFKEE